LRKRRTALGLPVLLVLLAVPLVVVAGTVSVPNTFVNGAVADADDVNANFDSVETAVNDNDSRITAAQAESLAIAGALATEEACALAAEAANSDAISAEETRALAAEAVLSASIASAGALDALSELFITGNHVVWHEAFHPIGVIHLNTNAAAAQDDGLRNVVISNNRIVASSAAPIPWDVLIATPGASNIHVLNNFFGNNGVANAAAYDVSSNITF
jgi:hypothetical protein